MNADLINGAFEFMAGLMMANNCRVLLRDRAVAGVSIASMAFFSAWGIWNLWYYPSLGQTWSFVGGIFVVTANVAYVALLWKYDYSLKLDILIFKQSPRGKALLDRWQRVKNQAGRIVCLFKGHTYDAHVFNPAKSMYFCTRCKHELLGRSIEDWKTLEPLDAEDLEEIHRSAIERYEEDHRHA